MVRYNGDAAVTQMLRGDVLTPPYVNANTSAHQSSGGHGMSELVELIVGLGFAHAMAAGDFPTREEMA